MTNMEKEELICRIQALDEDEQTVVADCLSDKVLVTEIMSRLSERKRTVKKVQEVLLNEIMA